MNDEHLSQEEINNLLNRKNPKENERVATKDELICIRESLIDLRDEHYRRSNEELAKDVDNLLNQIDSITFFVRENDDNTKLLVTFNQKDIYAHGSSSSSAFMSIPLK